jgi:hypothetical protein
VPLSDHRDENVKILVRVEGRLSVMPDGSAVKLSLALSRVALLARFDAVEEHTHYFTVERVLEHAVFIPGVDIGIIINFDDITAAVHLFDVHAVKAVADEIG